MAKPRRGRSASRSSSGSSSRSLSHSVSSGSVSSRSRSRSRSFSSSSSQSRSRSPPQAKRRKVSPPAESAVLCIDHLSRNVNEAHLKEIFGNFGEVVNVELSMDRMVNLPRGYGYIEFKKRADAEKALLHMDGGQIDGNIVKLRFTLQPRQRAASPVKAPPPPPKRDALQIEKGVSSAEKDAQQRPKESSPRRKPASPLRKRSPNRRAESPRRPPDPSPRRRPDSPPIRRRPDPSPLTTSKAVEEPTKKATTSTSLQSLSSSPTPSLPLQINFSKKGTRASIEAW
ncbi:Serine/arginine-rich splicing factor SR45 [Zea mays]|uniref:Serine/arginine-rich splicing factor SR45 n=1 Tax=Zea mays TaxID=4577 RepID=A0A3L6FQQ2_MAIZE|nr:Serine/arginine-rich splicing factor SR45 [Zea mays]